MNRLVIAVALAATSAALSTILHEATDRPDSPRH